MDRNKKFIGAIFALVVLLIFNLCSYTPFTVNTSPSVTKGIYFVVPKMFAREYEKDDMVIFNPPVDVKAYGGKRLRYAKRQSTKRNKST